MGKDNGDVEGKPGVEREEGERERKRQRHLCCWTTRGRVCCENSLLLPKKTRQ